MGKIPKGEIKEIRQRIYEIYGWTISEWAKRRGFSRWDVFNVLYGRSRGLRSKKAREILNRLEEDLKREAMWRLGVNGVNRQARLSGGQK